MGVFQFTWPYSAGQVFITGTFDDWRGSVQLKKNEEGQFTVNVDLGNAEKVYYKYIVDGNWTVNYEAKKEYDSSGNENNVLYAEDLQTPVMETPSLDEVPGGFPQTPAQEEKEPEPLPAGEPVSSIVAESTDDTLQLDQELEVPLLPEVVTPADEREANGTSVLDIPEFTAAEEETPAVEVPEIVQDSQAIANAAPEASADEALVEKKAELEQELIAEPPQLQHVEVEEEAPLAIAQEEPVQVAEPLSEKIESENQSPVTNGARSVSPTMSPLTTPAAPTTQVYTDSVPGATFTSQKSEPAPSTRSSSASSRESSHNEKIDILKDRMPEKKKEKRRSVILGRILNFFK